MPGIGQTSADCIPIYDRFPWSARSERQALNPAVISPTDRAEELVTTETADPLANHILASLSDLDFCRVSLAPQERHHDQGHLLHEAGDEWSTSIFLIPAWSRCSPY